MITLEARRGQAAEVDAWAAVGLSRSGLVRFLNEAQRAVGLAGAVDVLLADDRTLRRLNRDFRGKDKATDVLSFPAAEFAGDYVGDLAISLDMAARQAREQGHSLRDEVRVLLLHGLLHLSGMDHETDRGEMAAKEAELREKLRLKSGLIARVEGAASVRRKVKAKTGAQSVSRFELRDASKGRVESRMRGGTTRTAAKKRVKA